MTGCTHKIGGFTFGLLFISLNLHLPMMPIVLFSYLTPGFLIGCILGALFADIDSPKSTISRLFWFIAWPIWVVQWIIRKIFGKGKSKFAKNICKTVNHRGIAHWLIIALAYITIIIVIAKFKIFSQLFTFETFFEITLYFIYGTAVGHLSHIVLDSFNDRGIALFAPFSFKRISFAKIVTGTRKTKKNIFGRRTIYTDSKSENKFINILLLIITCLLAYNLGLIPIILEFFKK